MYVIESINFGNFEILKNFENFGNFKNSKFNMPL